MRIIMVCVASLILIGCNKFKTDIEKKLKSNKNIHLSDIYTNENHIDVRFSINSINGNIDIFSHINVEDSSVLISSFNNMTILKVVCDKVIHNETGYEYYKGYFDRFSFGKYTPMENRIDIRTIDDLVNNVERLDSVLKSMPEYPDSNSVFYSKEEDNDEFYYLKFNTKKYNDLTKFYDQIREDTARFKFCNCK